MDSEVFTLLGLRSEIYCTPMNIALGTHTSVTISEGISNRNN